MSHKTLFGFQLAGHFFGFFGDTGASCCFVCHLWLWLNIPIHVFSWNMMYNLFISSLDGCLPVIIGRDLCWEKFFFTFMRHPQLSLCVAKSTQKKKMSVKNFLLFCFPFLSFFPPCTITCGAVKGSPDRQGLWLHSVDKTFSLFFFLILSRPYVSTSHTHSDIIRLSKTTHTKKKSAIGYWNWPSVKRLSHYEFDVTPPYYFYLIAAKLNLSAHRWQPIIVISLLTLSLSHSAGRSYGITTPP